MNQISSYEDSSSLGVSTIAEIIGAYPLGELKYATRYKNGISNECYLVATSSGNYVLKVYNKARSREEILFELSLLNQLNSKGFPCPQPQLAIADEFLTEYQGSYCSVLSYLPGRSLTQAEIEEGVVTEAAVLYAWLRKALSGVTPLGARANADEEVLSLVANTHFAYDNLRRLELLNSTIQESVSHIGHHIGSQEIVHGDFFYENIIVDNGSIVGVIDFDDAYLGSSLLDFALAAMEFSVPEQNEQIVTSLFGTFARSYLSVLPELPGTPLEIVEAIRYQCCKFAVYLNELASTHIRHQSYHLNNRYITRLENLKSPDFRSRLARDIGRSMEEAFRQENVWNDCDE